MNGNSAKTNNFEQLEMEEEHSSSSYVRIYNQIKQNQDDLEEEIKKIYHQTLTLWFDVMCVRMKATNTKRYAENCKLQLLDKVNQDAK